jgi:riboflavin kinase/FMN adenylyltransferase
VRLYRSLEELPDRFRAGALTIGNFDGVHLGHAQLVRRLCERAAEHRGPSTVFTFEPHPVQILRPHQAPPPLTWTERKAELLAQLGVDVMLAYRTDHQLLNLTAEEFFERIVRRTLRAACLLEGPNFFFGKGRTGDVGLLQRLCRQAGVPLEIVPPMILGDSMISSSRIRQAISAGEVALARQMMPQPYRIRGVVMHGSHRGAGLGFPTANLGAIETLVPAAGVYAGRAQADDRWWPAAINVGSNPTFADQEVKFEVHLVGYRGQLYGRLLEVDFLARLRDIRPFPSVESLRQQLQQDVARCQALAATAMIERPARLPSEDSETSTY